LPVRLIIGIDRRGQVAWDSRSQAIAFVESRDTRFRGQVDLGLFVSAPTASGQPAPAARPRLLCPPAISGQKVHSNRMSAKRKAEAIWHFNFAENADRRFLRRPAALRIWFLYMRERWISPRFLRIQNWSMKTADWPGTSKPSRLRPGVWKIGSHEYAKPDALVDSFIDLRQSNPNFGVVIYR